MPEEIRIRIPDKVEKVLSALHQAGFEAYAVGGCVRDSILGRTPDDWDITTNALPGQVKQVFRRTIDTGIEHGTVTVRYEGESFEVTTYRLDGKYEDHRHPDNVSYTRNLREDLMRRDFTVNAMAYNDRDGLVDLFGGLADLRDQVVRCVGSPRERFDEDALRVLRAVRFCAKLGFRLDPATKEAATQMAPSLSFISAERIRTELEKLITSPHPEKMRLAYECGITAVVLPEFDAEMAAVQNNHHHRLTVGEHTIRTMMAAPPDRTLRWTMLLHDCGKPSVQRLDEKGVYHYHGHAAPGAEIAEKVLRRLKFDKASMRDIVHLVRNHSLYPALSEEGVRRAVVQLTPRLFPVFLQVKRSDIRGQNPEVQADKLDYMDKVEEIYHRVVDRGDCLSLRELALTGNDLIGMGFQRGAQIGEILGKLFDEVLQDPSLNTRAYLMERAKLLVL